MNKNVIILFLALVYGNIAMAQDQSENVKSASFTSKSISYIFGQLEDIYKVKIFFNADEQFEKAFSFGYEDKSINDVLDRLLLETTYSFVDYRGNTKVVLPRTMIEQTYSSDFYQALEGNMTNEKTMRRDLKIGDIRLLTSDGIAVVKGKITDIQSGDDIIGASVQFTDVNIGTVTDINGNFELNIPAGKHELLVSSLGFADYYKEVNVESSGEINISLDKGAVQLDEVTVRARAADERISGAQVGVESIDIKTIEKLPSFMGEVDLIRSFLLQPGVSSIGEGASGFNVRGGNVDQNLILQDEAILFNTSHALGFFSTFNTDLVQKVDLYKANIPARYGGRLVSVMDVQMKDGDFERLKINGGVGPVSSKISLEGPIVKDKVSFIGGFRSAYTDWLLSRLSDEELKNSSAFFYDANGRLTIKPNEKNTITLSAYAASDEFTFNQEFGFEYESLFGEFNYKTILSDKVFSDFSVVGSKYDSKQLEYSGLEGSQIDNNVNYIKAKETVKVVPNDEVEFNIGLETVNYYVDPGAQNPLGDESLVETSVIEEEKGRESAIFGDVTLNIGSNLTVVGGARFAYYQFLGPHEEFQYADENNPSVSGITGSTVKSGTIETYNSIEPRVSLRFKLSESAALKGGFSRTSQFLNQIFNSDTPTPSSIWQLSTRYIKPLKSNNASLGIFKNLKNNKWETSLEFYARQVDQMYDYKDFADLLVNDHLETELLNGEGRAYGAEVSIKRNSGKLNGWLSYTYAKSERKVEGINNGEWYKSNFDKTNDLSLILNYEPNQRNTLTINFNYSTGRPTTPPLGNFLTQTGVLVPVFATRNSQRIPDYMRLDMAYTLGRGYRKDQKFRTSWTLSLYNVLGRKNAFSVYYTRGPNQGVQANKLSILGSVFPSLTVNFELL